MRLAPTSERPCALRRGQARRVPQNARAAVLGYHICCPRCGYVTVALQGNDGLLIEESPDRAEVSFSKGLRCIYCKVLIHVTSGEITLEEDEHVRSVRYR
jgi:hypothetical protein